MEKVVHLLHTAHFCLNLHKLQLQPCTGVMYCGLQFERGGHWDFSRDKVHTLKEVLCTWDNAHVRRTRQYLGFLAYVLNTLGLSTAWAELVQTCEVWWYIFWNTFSRLPCVWKDKRLRSINWTCNAADTHLAVVDHRTKLQWHVTHHVHINGQDDGIGQGNNPSTKWSNDLVRLSGSNSLDLMGQERLAALCIGIGTDDKDIAIWWLPTEWNPADHFTRLSPPYKLTDGIGKQWMGLVYTLRKCMIEALEYGEFTAQESDVARSDWT